MSEKYDGVRAFWDGQKLVSRSGRVFNAPSSFTQGFPPFMLDGELFLKRGMFEKVVSIVNSKDASIRWNKLSYRVFEVPLSDGDLFKRLGKVEDYVKKHKNTPIKVVKQVWINDKHHMQEFYERLLEQGAEGIVVRNPHLPYYARRTNDALKIKPFFDAECEVMEHFTGKGKYKDMMGALTCLYKNKTIRIGSGFSDKERKNPPRVGDMVSFKYYGLTALGNPKYPVFLYIRNNP